NLVVAGDGPLRERVPNALGAVPHAEVERLLERASVVVAPCERGGFGLAAAGAVAFGRPAAAAARGALRVAVPHRATGRRAAARRRCVQPWSCCSQTPSCGNGSAAPRVPLPVSASAGTV